MGTSTPERTLKRKKLGTASGFSLMELLIVIAIIGILAAVGYPSYTDYVLKTKRSDGIFGLLEAVQSMERCKSTQFSYANCTISGGLAISPEKFYKIELETTPTASNFTLIATPDGSQASDSECESLSIDQLGNQTSKPGADGTDENNCWN